MKPYTYYKDALNDTAKPCAFIDIDILRQNIRDIASTSNGKTIRVASKSIRSVAVLKDILAASPIFQGIMCFTAEEAVYLHQHGLDDLLIAYPVWNQYHLQQIAKLRKDKHTITVMVDSTEHIERLEQIAKKEDSTFLVCLDFDLSSDYFGLHFGVHRSQVKTTEHAMALIHRIRDSRYLQLDGIMGYEAQIAGVTDQDPNQQTKSSIIRLLKRKSATEITKKRKDVMEQLQSNDINVRFINGGGTGSLSQTAHDEPVTEVTVGSGFFHPGLFDYYQEFKRQPAAGFAIEITRRPSPNIYTCAGGGYIASGPVNKDKEPRVYLPEGAQLIANEGAGEVQTPIYYDGPQALEHGDPIIMRHSKAGELCERFTHLHLIQSGKIMDTYTTYRGDYQCFL